MRELVAKLRFTQPCLGNIKRYSCDSVSGRRWPYYVLPRTPENAVRFETRWWRSNMQFAAKILCRHTAAVKQIQFDIAVEGTPRPEPGYYYKRYFDKKRYVKHEAFLAGDEIAVRCIVPNNIRDEDFAELLRIAGRFRGISPFGPGEYGFFSVVSVEQTYGRQTGTEDTQSLPGRQSDTHQASDEGIVRSVVHDVELLPPCSS